MALTTWPRGGVGGGERRGGEVGHVPRAHDQAARIRVGADGLDDLAELVDVPAVRRGPGAPLVPIYRSEVPVGFRPLVPDRNTGVVQRAHVGLATEEPEQLVDDRPIVDFLGGDERESQGEIEAHLPAEDAERAGAGPVVLGAAVLEDVAHQVEVLLHRASVRSNLLTAYPASRSLRRRRASSPAGTGAAPEPALSEANGRSTPAGSLTPGLRIPDGSNACFTSRKSSTISGPNTEASAWARRRPSPSSPLSVPPSRTTAAVTSAKIAATRSSHPARVTSGSRFTWRLPSPTWPTRTPSTPSRSDAPRPSPGRFAGG